MQKITDYKKHLLSKIIKLPNECWEWQGALQGKGYGFTIYKGKTMTAHRASYIVFKQEIPDRLQICHHCDNKKCINPKHLFLGTGSDNMQDAMTKGRMKNVFSKGHKSTRRFLSETKVKSIKKSLLQYPAISLKDIAKKHKISYDNLRSIRRGSAYKNVKI